MSAQRKTHFAAVAAITIGSIATGVFAWSYLAGSSGFEADGNNEFRSASQQFPGTPCRSARADGLFIGQVEEEGEAAPERPLFNARIYPFGSVDVEAIQQSRLQRQHQQRLRPAGLTPHWIQRGPNNIQGRVTDLAVDPRDDDVCYIAAAEGGVFKTTDGGATWIPVFDDMPSMSMGAIAIDPLNPNIVYAGTGEPNTSADSYPGTGIYKSLDAGATWTQSGLPDSATIARIIIHPTNTSIIHVAVMGNVWSPTTERGVYRSTDAGATWTQVLYVDDIVGCADIVQREDDPDILFAAMWERYRTPQVRITGGPGCGVYKSEDGGLTWTLHENGLPVSSADNGRIGLAMAASNNDVMCAIYTQTSGPFMALYRTTDGGDNWVQTNDGNLSGMYSSFGWYFGNVRIDPNNQDVIYALGQSFYRSDDGGQTWGNISGMHVDHHAFGFGASSSPKMYCGNDGGVYTSTDGINFAHTTGDLPITQAYRIASADWNSEALWLGTQDNGTLQDLNANGQFNRIFGGDGFATLPHLTDSNRIWAQYQWGNVFYNDGNGFVDAREGLSGRRGWDAPHSQDPNDPEVRYFGTDSVHRNVGDTSWEAISGDLTNGGGQGSLGVLTTIEASPADANTIWAGSNDGLVHVTTDSGANWTLVSDSLPNRWITSVRPHPTEPAEALVSVSGFRWGEDVAHVYRTVDTGLTWTAVDSGLPDMPVSDVFYDSENPFIYYAATDIGVFVSRDAGGNWQPFGTGMPAVAVVDFAELVSLRKLFAGTHGRSIFEITIPEAYANSLQIVNGNLSAGSTDELRAGDNRDLSVSRGNTVRSVVTIELKSRAHIASPSQLAFVVEASVFARGAIEQTISLFDYNANQWEEVDTRPSSRFSDQIVEIKPAGDISRFIEPETNCMEARIQFNSSVNRTQFSANLDRAHWAMVE